MPSVLTCVLRKGNFDCRLVTDGQRQKFSNVSEIDLSGNFDTVIMQNSVVVSTEKVMSCEYDKKEGVLSCGIGKTPKKAGAEAKEEEEVPWWERFRFG